MASLGLSGWLTPVSALLFGLVSGYRETRLAMQLGNDIRVFGGQTQPSDIGMFISCLCGKGLLNKSCTVSFAEMNLTLNMNSYRSSIGRNCSEVQENQDQKIVVKYANANIQCTTSPYAVYIDIVCPSSCLTMLRYETLFESSAASQVVLAEKHACKNPCCKVVFDPKAGKDSGNASTVATHRIETTSPVLSTLKKLVTMTSSSPSLVTNIYTPGLAVSTNFSSTLYSPSPEHNLTTSAKSSATSETDKRDVMLLIACIVTATLALAAIVISAAACRRHSSRSGSSASTALVGLGGESTIPQAERNVYSALNPEYSGSTQKYADLSQCGKELVDHDAAEEYAQQEDERMSTIYDNIVDIESEYLQPSAAFIKN